MKTQTGRMVRKRGGTDKRNNGAQSAKMQGIPAATAYTMGSGKTSARGVHIEEGRVKIADLAGSTSFVANRIQLNPGLIDPFGVRLANIASGYEKYCFHKDLRVEYVPSQAVTTTKGTVWLGFDYDPMDGGPLTDEAFSTYETWASTNVFQRLELGMSKGRAFDGVQHKRVREGPVGADLGLYDPGSLIVATDDCADTADLGKLYLHYSFVFISPQTSTSRFTNSLYFAQSSSDTPVSSGVTTLVPLVDVQVNGTGFSTTGGAVTVLSGSYLITLTMLMRNTAAVATTFEPAIFVDGSLEAATTLSLPGGFAATTIQLFLRILPGETKVITFGAEIGAASGTLTILGGPGTAVSICAL